MSSQYLLYKAIDKIQGACERGLWYIRQVASEEIQPQEGTVGWVGRENRV